jgi:invasion protein IalB
MPMIDATKALVLTLSLGLSGAAFAQDAAAPATPAPAATETPAAPAAAPAAPAAEAQTGPGSIYVKEKSGAWEVRCMRVPEGNQEPCQIYQLLKDAQGGQVAEIAVFPMPEAEEAVAGATVSVPLETLLTARLTIQIDENKPLAYSYDFCDQIACVARVGFSDADLAAMKNGKEAKIIIVPARAPDQKVVLTASLDGITKGYDSLPLPVPPKPQN